MDPGRRAIEQREASYLTAGDRIFTEHGREFEVVSWTEPDAARHMEFTVRSAHTAEEELLVLAADETVRVRVKPRGNVADSDFVQ
ncbi:MAG: hypothetical protein ABIN55_03140 [Aeromicrobium sp.]